MQLPTLVPRCFSETKEEHNANLRENRDDISCYRHNRGEQHSPSRSLVRLSSSLLTIIATTATTIIATTIIATTPTILATTITATTAGIATKRKELCGRLNGRPSLLAGLA
jgi:hypothetical protein